MASPRERFALPRDLLWIDGSGGMVVGVVVLLLHEWIAGIERLPVDFVRMMGVANVLYGSYSLTLASRRTRPAALILLLVVANAAWGVACMRWAIGYAETASIFGLAHLVSEGAYVMVLAAFEWRWRERLRVRE
jgi:hypothetical protein